MSVAARTLAAAPSPQKRQAPTPVVQYNISDKGVASIDANVALQNAIVQKQLTAVARLREAAARAAK